MAATGDLGGDNIDVRYGTLNLNNANQIVSGGLVLGDGAQGNGNSTVNIGTLVTLASNITYEADSVVLNTGLIAGGTINLTANRTVNVNDHASISGPELTISSDFMSNNGNRTLIKNGQGTLLLSGSSIANGSITVQNGVLQLQQDNALNTVTRNVTVQNQNSASGITPNVEFDLNGADATIFDLNLGNIITNLSGGGGTVSVRTAISPPTAEPSISTVTSITETVRRSSLLFRARTLVVRGQTLVSTNW